MNRILLASLTLGTALAAASSASAFCGFYVSGADSSLYNNATMVVMMRVGTRTVLSMQNSYQGPPQDFAMVVPVPTVLREDNVKTLPREIFGRVDSLAAPRLVKALGQNKFGHGPELGREVAGLQDPARGGRPATRAGWGPRRGGNRYPGAGRRLRPC